MSIRKEADLVAIEQRVPDLEHVCRPSKCAVAHDRLAGCEREEVREETLLLQHLRLMAWHALRCTGAAARKQYIEESLCTRVGAQTSQRCVMSELESEVSAARAEAEGATQRLRGESAAERARIEASVRNDLAASFAHLDDKIEERIRATRP